MRNILGRFLVFVVVVPTVTVLFASSASGVWWGQPNRLKVYDGNQFAGQAYGEFYNSGNAYAKNRAGFIDMAPGGDTVRVETDFYFYESGPTCGGGACYVFDVSKQTSETNSGKWVSHTRSRGLHGGATRARGGVDICEIHAWSNDPCSGHAWPSFAY